MMSSAVTSAVEISTARFQMMLSSIGFVVAIILFVINAVVSYRNIVDLADNDRWVSHTYQVLGELEGLISTVKDVETNQRGYLLSQLPRYLEAYRAAIEATHARMAAIKRLTADNSAQQRHSHAAANIRWRDLRQWPRDRHPNTGGELRLRRDREAGT